MTAPSPTSPEPLAPAWSTGRKVAFRFACSYFVLYLSFYIPKFKLEVWPFLEKVVAPYSNAWYHVVPWVGQHLLHLSAPISVPPTFDGSVDGMYHYVQLLCFIIMAAASTLVWSVADRDRPNYTRAHEWLRVIVRYSLALTMISYGTAKVIKSQFPSMNLQQLLQPFGNATPQGLLWRYMGYSMPYNVFTGAAETLAGILLALRRTTTLGALLAISVLSNVVMLNFSYDVGVKLFSLNLLAMALFLLLPDLGRLVNMLLLNRAVPAAPVRPLFSRPRLNLASKALGVLFVIAVTAMDLAQSRASRSAWGDTAPKPPLYGIYEVATFVRNRDTLPPLTTDTTRWQRLVVPMPGVATITFMNDSVRGHDAVLDTTNGTMLLTSWDDSTVHFTMAYARPDSGQLVLAGVINSDSIFVTLARRDEGNFRLLKWGFHWITE